MTDQHRNHSGSGASPRTFDLETERVNALLDRLAESERASAGADFESRIAEASWAARQGGGGLTGRGGAWWKPAAWVGVAAAAGLMATAFVLRPSAADDSGRAAFAQLEREIDELVEGSGSADIVSAGPAVPEALGGAVGLELAVFDAELSQLESTLDTLLSEEGWSL